MLKLRMGGAIPPLPLYAFMACIMTNFALPSQGLFLPNSCPHVIHLLFYVGNISKKFLRNDAFETARRHVSERRNCVFRCSASAGLVSIMTGWLTAWLADWLIDWLIGWLTGWWTDWLTGWLIDWLTDWLVDWPIDGLAGWLTGWLTDWLAGRLTDWLAGWLTGWLAGWMTDWPTNCLADWLTQSRTPWTGVLLEKLIVSQLAKNSSNFMEYESSLPCSQQLTTCPYLVPDKSSPDPHILFLSDQFNRILPSTIRFSKPPLSFSFPRQFPFSPLCAKCPAYRLFLLDFINVHAIRWGILIIKLTFYHWRKNHRAVPKRRVPIIL